MWNIHGQQWYSKYDITIKFSDQFEMIISNPYVKRHWQNIERCVQKSTVDYGQFNLVIIGANELIDTNKVGRSGGSSSQNIIETVSTQKNLFKEMWYENRLFF